MISKFINILSIYYYQKFFLYNDYIHFIINKMILFPFYLNICLIKILITLNFKVNSVFNQLYFSFFHNINQRNLQVLFNLQICYLQSTD